VADRVQVRETDDDEGRQLLRIIRSGSGSRATYNRYGGVRHLFAALDLAKEKLYGRIRPVKKRTQFLESCRYLRNLYPPEIRTAIVCDNFSPHLTTKKCQWVGTWAAANNVEITCTPTNSSWLNRIEASSPLCATSPPTAPITPTTRRRAA
jgi:hypothetical protein